MRFPDRRYYGRIAASTGFRPEPLERVFRLATLLQTIDLDFIGTAHADEARRRRPPLLETIEGLARASGYKVIPERPSYAMAHLRMHYGDIEERPAFIKVDVNFLDRVPVMVPERRLVAHPFQDDVPAFEIQTFTLSELSAAKLIALCRRALARDLFDAAAFSELADLRIDEVRTVLVVRGAAYPPPSPTAYEAAVVDRIRQVSWTEVVALARQPVPFTLDQARSHAAGLLTETLQLDKAHRRFLDLLEAGELRPDVLPLPELHPRISANPGLLWRMRVGAEALEER